MRRKKINEGHRTSATQCGLGRYVSPRTITDPCPEAQTTGELHRIPSSAAQSEWQRGLSTRDASWTLVMIINNKQIFMGRGYSTGNWDECDALCAFGMSQILNDLIWLHFTSSVFCIRFEIQGWTTITHCKIPYSQFITYLGCLRPISRPIWTRYGGHGISFHAVSIPGSS